MVGDGSLPAGGVMERWMALEMTRFHRGFVSQPKPLADLVQESEPTATTRSGEVHHYDAVTLRRIYNALSPLTRRRVRLPVTFFVDKDMSDDVHVADEPAIEMLRALGELTPGMEPREGKLWMGHARARLVAQKYPGAFQFVYF